jgi:hypothetical protein
MPSHQIQIEIFEQQQHLGTKQRPLRDTPDGSFGVVFRGEVHPLNDLTDKDSDWSWFVSDEQFIWGIDIASGTTFDPVDCPATKRFQDFELLNSAYANQSDQYTAIDWFLDISKFRCYIALNGTSDELEAAVDQLGMHGFDVVNYGASMRLSSNGQAYDWFIRLSNSKGILSDKQQLRRSIEETFGGNAGFSKKTTASDTPENIPIASVIRELDDLGIKLTTDGKTIFYRGLISKLSDELEESVLKNKDALLSVLIEAGMTESPGNSPDQAPLEYSASNEAGGTHKILDIAELRAELGLPTPVSEPKVPAAVLNITGDVLGTVREVAEILRDDNISTSSIDSVRDQLTWFIETQKPENIESVYLHGFRHLGVLITEIETERAHTDLKNSEQEKTIEIQAAKIKKLESSAKTIDHSQSNAHTENHAKSTAKINSLTEQLEIANSRCESATNDWASAEEQREDLEADIDLMTSTINRLKSRLASVGESDDLIESVLLHTTPEIVYRGKSFSLLATFTDPSSPLKRIVELNSGNQINSKKNTRCCRMAACNRINW